MSFTRPKLTTKIFLLIVLPMFLQWGFLLALHEQLQKAEGDYQTQHQFVQLLNAVNTMLCDYTMFVTMSHYSDKTHQRRFEIEQGVAALNFSESFNAINDICKQYDTPDIRAFAKIWKQLQSMLTGFLTPKVLPDYDKLAQIRKMVIEAISTLMHSEEGAGERLAIHRRDLDQILLYGAMGDFLVIILLTVWFSLTLGRRFNHIVEDSVKLSAGQPLLKPLGGDDELDRVDKAMHRLSDELAVVRKQDRALIDNTAEVIFSIDTSLRVIQVNGAVTKRLGYDQEQFSGALITSFVAEPDRLFVYQKLNEVIAARSEITFECSLKDSFDYPHPAEVTAQWSKEDSSVFCVARDITARKEAERLKQEVLAMVSHDLRAPLTSLKLTLSLIAEKFKKSGDLSGTEAVGVAKQSVTSLYNLTSDLLDLESYEAIGVHLDYEEAAIADLVAQAIKVVGPDAESRGVEISSAGDSITAEVDATKIGRVILNLLHNAIKFSPRGKTVSLSWALVPDALPAAVEIKVSDHGPGIDEDKQQMIFDKYRQAGTGSEGEQLGVGLGLAICKALVEAHDGTIGIDSRKGEGSTFRFQLPLHPKPKQS